MELLRLCSAIALHQPSSILPTTNAILRIPEENARPFSPRDIVESWTMKHSGRRAKTGPLRSIIPVMEKPSVAMSGDPAGDK